MPTGRLVSTLASRRRHVADTFLEALHTGQTPDFQNGLETVEDEQAYRTRINNDLMACIKTIHHITGQYPDMLFWPWGEYSDTSIEVAQALGFRWSFSTAKGLVRPDRDGNTIPRIGASPRWNKFRRNAFTYRHPACARFHQLVSPSPSGQIRDVEG
jgi:peptidoglycan/xylan/chitin deacetylase (PgdA/CDA1 family)